MFLTFWVANVHLATAACKLSTAQRPKMFWKFRFFSILSCKCASRHNGVQFFHISTSKNGPELVCFVHFDLKLCFSLQRRAIFPHLNFKKRSGAEVFCTFWLENVLLATAACNFSCLLETATSAPAALPSLLFDPANTQTLGKTQHFATVLTFRAGVSSFFWLSRNCNFFLLTPSLLCFSSSDSATLLCFFNCPYCRKLDF